MILSDIPCWPPLGFAPPFGAWKISSSPRKGPSFTRAEIGVSGNSFQMAAASAIRQKRECEWVGG